MCMNSTKTLFAVGRTGKFFLLANNNVYIKKKSIFTFNENLFKQFDGVDMCSSLGPTFANACSLFFDKNWLWNCPSDFKLIYYRRYGDEIFTLFTSPKDSKVFQNFQYRQPANVWFIIENEKQNQNVISECTDHSWKYNIYHFCLPQTNFQWSLYTFWEPFIIYF